MCAYEMIWHGSARDVLDAMKVAERAAELYELAELRAIWLLPSNPTGFEVRRAQLTYLRGCGLPNRLADLYDKLILATGRYMIFQPERTTR